MRPFVGSFALLALLLAWIVPLRAQSSAKVDFNAEAKASITYTLQSNLSPSRGWMPVAVHIENQEAESRTWRATFSFQNFYTTTAGRTGSSSMSSLETFTVAAHASLDKVIYVPAGVRGFNGVPLHVETSGPDVRFPTSMLSCVPTIDPRYGFVAASPALADGLMGLRNGGQRRVVYTVRDGSLQTRNVSVGMRLTLKISNGASVIIPAAGSPTLTQAGSGADVVSFKETPNGDVTVSTPAGVFIEQATSRMDPGVVGPASGGLGNLRRVLIRGSSTFGGTTQRIYVVPQQGDLEFLFSDGSTLVVPSAGNFRLKSSSADVQVQDGPNNEVSVTLSNSATMKSYTNHNRSGAGGVGSAPNTNGITNNIAKVDPQAWPADARVWSNFTLVMLESSEWERLDEARQVALRDWVIAGGVLVLSPDAYAAERVEDVLGMGKMVHLEKPVRDCTQSEVIALGLSNLARRETPWEAIKLGLLSNSDRQSLSPTGNSSIVLLLLIAFALAVGPLSLFVLAPQGKRHRLFVIIPALGLGTSVLLAVLVITRDGVGGHGIRRSVVVLVPKEKRALVMQTQLCRTGLVLGSDFPLPEDVLCVGGAVDSHGNGQSSASLVSVREKDRARGDWFVSRSLLQHDLIRVASSRAQVELIPSKAEAGYSVRSNLACELKDFAFLDSHGTWWMVPSASPGAVVALHQVKDSKEVTRLAALYPLACASWFYASGGATEMAPLPTLAHLVWDQDSILYCGLLTANEPASAEGVEKVREVSP